MKTYTTLFTICLASLFCTTTQLSAQEVLPFPEPPSASVVGKTLKSIVNLNQIWVRLDVELAT